MHANPWDHQFFSPRALRGELNANSKLCQVLKGIERTEIFGARTHPVTGFSDRAQGSRGLSRLNPIATDKPEDDMPRLIMTFALLIGFLLGSFNSASAEVFRPDLGMGLSDYLAKVAQPMPGSPAQIAPSQPLGIPPIDGRMMISPKLIEGTNDLAVPLFVDQKHQGSLRAFWTYMAILSLVFLGGSYVLGRQVVKRGWKVGYTRKAQALALYFLPYFAMQGPSPYSPITTATISLGVFVGLLLLLSNQVRRFVPAMATAFASIDRPEDRPFTLTWLISSVAVVWVIICLWIWLAPETTAYLFVALFISGVGDALAEPVGLYFGRHSYRTTALGTDRTYIRTYEGSAAVFLSGIVAVLLLHGFQMNMQSLLALALFPIIGTIAEAKSPHTWDQPFIIGACAATAIGLATV